MVLRASAGTVTPVTVGGQSDLPVQWAPLVAGSLQDSAPGTGSAASLDEDDGDLPYDAADLANRTIKIDEQQQEVWCGDPNEALDDVARRLRRQEQEDYDGESTDGDDTDKDEEDS